MQGEIATVREKEVAALMHELPKCGRLESLKLGRIWKSEGVSRLCPPRSRVPKAWPVVAAVACTGKGGHRSKAMWVVVAHGTYGRPSEVMRLRRKDLVRPRAALANHWSVIFAPRDNFHPTKTGAWDVGVL